MRQPGIIVGQTDSDGVRIDGEWVDRGDCSGPKSARRVLSDPRVDVAVLETARGGMLREGLAFQHCNIGIVNNVSDDHLGKAEVESLEDLWRVKRIVAEAVLPDGHCILNADDPWCVRMASHTKGKVVFFSLKADNPVIKEAISKGKTVWFISNGDIVCHHNGSFTRFMKAAGIPITLNGLAQYNIANALASLAAAHAAGKPLKQLRTAIMTFQLSAEQNKGRLNVYRSEDRCVIVDFAHNPAGLQAIYQTLAPLVRRRLITVASMPGDRQDDAIRQSARIMSQFSDVLVIKEDADLRGRKPREVAHLIRTEALGAGLPASWLPIVSEEYEACRKAWEMSQPGDIVLCLYDEFDKIEQFLKEINCNTTEKDLSSLIAEEGRNKWLNACRG